MQKLRHVSPFSLAKVMALYNGIATLVVLVPVYVLFTLIGFGNGLEIDGAAGLGSGIIVVLLYPLIATGAGFLGGLITAWILNFVLEYLGGLRISITSRPKRRKDVYKPVH